MAWSDYRGGLGQIAASPRESERFGYSVARLTVGRDWQETSPTVERLGDELWSRVAAAEEQVVIVRFPSELARLPAHGAALPGWTLLPAGSMLYWSLDAETLPAPRDADGTVVSVHEGGDDGDADVAALLEALTSSFADYTNHYSANPLFDPGLVAAGYREWAESTLRDPQGQSYGLWEAGRAIGVAVSRCLGTEGEEREIELAGIVPESQGAGRYRRLLQAVAEDARGDGIRTIHISTQSHNIRVQRAWAAFGFRPEGSVDTVHAVRSALLARHEG